MNGYGNGPALMLPAASTSLLSTTRSVETNPTQLRSTNAKAELCPKESFLEEEKSKIAGSQVAAAFNNTMCPPQRIPGYGIGQVNPRRRVIFPVLHGKASASMTRIPCTLEQHRNGGIALGQVTGGASPLGADFSRRMAAKATNASPKLKVEPTTQPSSISTGQAAVHNNSKPSNRRILSERQSSLMPSLERVSSASLSSTESLQGRSETPLKTDKKPLRTVRDEGGQDTAEEDSGDIENPFLKFAFGLIQSLSPGNHKSSQPPSDEEEPMLVRKCKSLGSISESAAEATALNVGKTLSSAVAQNNIDATKGSSTTSNISKPRFPKRSTSEPVFQEKDRAVSFDPRVFVVEFSDGLKSTDKWYSPEELCRFQHEAIALAVKKRRQQTASLALSSWRNGGGGAVAGALMAEEEKRTLRVTTAFDKEDDDVLKRKLAGEIRSVLIVDPHDIFCKLLTKAIQKLLPHEVHVVTAHSSEEAIQRMEAAKLLYPAEKGGASMGFDLVVAEERLPPTTRGGASSTTLGVRQGCSSSLPHNSLSSSATMPPAQSPKEAERWPNSGSGLIQRFSEEEKKWKRGNSQFRASFLVGITAHLDKDRTRFMESGADMVWGKPPPPMDQKLRCEMLKSLMKKREETLC